MRISGPSQVAFCAALLLSLTTAGVHAARPPQPAPAPQYEKDLLPLFRAKCIGCHGAGNPEAGFDLRTRGDVLEGGHSGPGVVPGSPEKSPLYLSLADGRMPKGGRKFTPQELKLVETWIRQGAPGRGAELGHWSFRKPVRPAVPVVKARSRVRNPIDAFVLRDLESRGLTLSPEADRRTLLRRVYFDLLGLPPTPAETAQFLKECAEEDRAAHADAPPGSPLPRRGRGAGGESPSRERSEPHPPAQPHTPRAPARHTPGAAAPSHPQGAHSRPAGAYERLVDRLLADPRYGERWARHWLDTAGYTDSEGVLQEDRIRPNAWMYRDYVIKSLNSDKPYDRFLREQLAGDELVDYRNAKEFTPEIVEALTATGFLRNAVDGTRPDFNPHQYGEYQYRMLHDTQTIVFSTILGLTVQCSRCHNHKYEPLSHKDYYAVQSLFMGAVRPRGTLLPSALRQIVAAPEAEQKRAQQVNAQVDSRVAALNQQLADLLREHQARDLEKRTAEIEAAAQATLPAAIRAPEAKRDAAQKALVAKYQAKLRAAEALAAADPEFKEKQAALFRERDAENAKRITHPQIRAFYDQDANPPATPLLLRGDWLKPGPTVEPGVPAILAQTAGPLPWTPPAAGAATTGRRRAFAEWITQRDHPLTARVMVNRVWAQHFGLGIVPSLDNLGRSGSRPSHPELLDYLATVFSGAGGQGSGAGAGIPVSEAASGNGSPNSPRIGGRGADPASSSIPHPSSFAGSGGATPTQGLDWSIKRLHKLILTSSTYRQASAWRPEAAKIDPEGSLLWRQRPRRLEAEVIRDSVLAAAGTLDSRMFGEAVPNVVLGTGEVVAAGEEQGGRRSIYLLSRRSMPVTLLNAFDAPIIETNCTRRTTSTTATQALALMNGSFLSSQSKHFAASLLKASPPASTEAPADARTVELAFQRALSRAPSAKELADSLVFVREQAARYQSIPAAAGETPAIKAYADLCHALLSSNEFVYVD